MRRWRLRGRREARVLKLSRSFPSLCQSRTWSALISKPSLEPSPAKPTNHQTEAPALSLSLSLSLSLLFKAQSSSPFASCKSPVSFRKNQSIETNFLQKSLGLKIYYRLNSNTWHKQQHHKRPLLTAVKDPNKFYCSGGMAANKSPERVQFVGCHETRQCCIDAALCLVFHMHVWQFWSMSEPDRYQLAPTNLNLNLTAINHTSLLHVDI